MILAADNIHALNPIVSEAMQKLDPAPIRELALKMVANGAALLDVNPGYLTKRKLDRMRFLVETIEDAVDVPLIFDSPSSAVLAAGLSVCRNKPILSALSLEEAKLKEILPLAVKHQTPLVILLMDENSFTPPAVDEKIALAIELRERALTAGIPADNLIFDPVLPNCAWEDSSLRISEDIETVRLLANGAIFNEPTRTMVGLSNLRSGAARASAELESVALLMLAGAGLQIALANVLRDNVQSAYKWITEFG